MGNCLSYSYSSAPDEVLSAASSSFVSHLKKNLTSLPTQGHEIEWIKLQKTVSMENIGFFDFTVMNVRLAYIDTQDRFFFTDINKKYDCVHTDHGGLS